MFVTDEELKKFDHDGNGEIDYREFLAMQLSEEKVEELKLAFEHFDQNGDGFITPEEFKSALSEMTWLAASSQVDELANYMNADLNGDGKISFQEFLTREMLEKIVEIAKTPTPAPAPVPEPEPEAG